MHGAYAALPPKARALLRRATVRRILARNEPARGPLDHPVSVAHVADLHREIARLEAKGGAKNQKRAAGYRKALAQHGIT